MIVKMKFINISGPRDDIDRVTDLYLSTCISPDTRSSLNPRSPN